MNNRRYRSLDDALERIPRELPPTRDLWPGIAQATARATGQAIGQAAGQATNQSAAHRPRWALWSMALAASLSVIGLVGALVWAMWRAPPASRMRFEPPQSVAYLKTHAALEGLFRERLQLLTPATRNRIEADLSTIRSAHDDIRAALGKDPASPLLLQLLRSTWRQEIDLYSTVAHATDPLLPRRT